MPKRYLTVQNKDDEQQQTLSKVKSLRKNNDQTVKKSEIKETNIDKENKPKRQSNDKTNKRKHSPSINIEVISDTNQTDSDNDEVEEPLFSSIDDEDHGKDYPANKQYLIYENATPKKEPLIISKTARYWSFKYRKVLCHVNPDAYGMYIHADFSCYGELEVVENCLLDLTKSVFIVQQGILDRLSFKSKPVEKVNYVLGFRRLEALTILLDYTNGISGIDDGERFGNMIRVIGACYVTILHGLLPRTMFKKLDKIDDNLIKTLNKIAKQIPNFKQVLERALIIGHMFVTIGDICSAYTNILQIIYRNWILMMEKVSIDFNKKSDQFNEKLWNTLKHAAQIDKDNIDYDGEESFDFMKELHSYRKKYGLGGDSHDLSKWTRSERNAYAYGRFDRLGNFWV